MYHPGRSETQMREDQKGSVLTFDSGAARRGCGSVVSVVETTAWQAKAWSESRLHQLRIWARHLVCQCMSTAQEIEQAIRSLPTEERIKLLRDLPSIFPELGGDAEWDRILQDETPRAELTKLLNEAEADYGRDEIGTRQDFDRQFPK